MAFKAVTLRKRLYANIFGVASVEHAGGSHGHFMEYLINVIGILCAIGYVVGSYCFYSLNSEVYAIGDWCYIISSIINVGISCHTLLEQVHAMELEWPLKDSRRDELRETLLFLCAASCFSIGCIFFMPGLTTTAIGGYDVQAIGSWFCIVGSFGIVFGVFYNGMGFHADECDHGIEESVAKLCVTITKYGMFVLLTGGALFVVGSFMYRPVFGGTCPRGSTDATCMVLVRYGTTMYLWGSWCLVTQGVMTLTVCVLKHHAEDNAPAELKPKKNRRASA